VGVGSAVNRSLVAPIARAGRGVEAIVGLGEDPERAALRVLARTVAPRVVDVVLEGSALRRVMPSRLPDVYAGSPLRAAVELHPEGGVLRVRGRTPDGAFVREIAVAPSSELPTTSAIAKLFARELVEDLEMRISSGEERGRLEAEIERAAKGAQISSRLTSWIAVSERALVDPREPSRRVVQPHALAHGLSAEGLGLRSPSSAFGGAPSVASAESFAESGLVRDQLAFYDDEAPSNTMVGTLSPKQHEMIEETTRRFRMGAPPPPAAARPAPMAPGAPPPPPRSAAPEPVPSARLQREEKKQEADASVSRAAPAPSKAKRRVEAKPQARVRHVADRRIVVELWADPQNVTTPSYATLSHATLRATVRLRDGRVLALRLVPEQSSREGELSIGIVYRLVLELDEPITREDVVSVELDLGDLQLEAQ
jgi:Ca-activated chloride channel family protein